MRGLLPIVLLVCVYVATYFLSLGGVLFYALPTLGYLILFFITLKLLREVPLDKGVILVATATSILQLSLYMFTGIIQGFGDSPFDRSWSGITLNVLYVTSQALGIEFTRAYVVKSLRYKHESIAIILPSVLFTFLYVSPLKLWSLSLDVGTMKWVTSNLLPLFARSALASYMVYSGGPIPSVIYVGTLDIFKRLSPILPNTEWFINGMLGTFIPLLGYVILVSYNVMSKPRLRVRRYRSDIKTVVKATLIIVLVTITLLIPSGIFGFRPAIVVSGSMQPSLNVGDIAIIAELSPKDVGNIKVGDIIGYVSKRGLIIHRVVGFDYINGKKYLILKGDANPSPDPDPVHPQQVIGKYVGKVPTVGWLAIYLRKLPQLMFLTLKQSTNRE